MMIQYFSESAFKSVKELQKSAIAGNEISAIAKIVSSHT